jgi:hypothetical protein
LTLGNMAVSRVGLNSKGTYDIPYEKSKRLPKFLQKAPF